MNEIKTDAIEECFYLSCKRGFNQELVSDAWKQLTTLEVRIKELEAEQTSDMTKISKAKSMFPDDLLEDCPTISEIYDILDDILITDPKLENTRPAQDAKADETPERPKIICLCGSTRFYNEFQKANYTLTMDGHIVLSVGFYPHSQKKAHGEEVGCSPEQKKALDELHLRKIDIADEIFVINPGRYVGNSTAREIEYAYKHNKIIKSYEPLPEMNER
jgi:hypothetical protein